MTLNRKLLSAFCFAFILVGCGERSSSPITVAPISASNQLINAPLALVPSQQFTSRPPAAIATLSHAGVCPSAGALGPQFDAIVPPHSVDVALFDSAVLHFTNIKRCANGVAPVAGDPALRQIATTHSNDMATLNFFSHTSPVSGRNNLSDRLKGAGINFMDASENIALRSRLQMISGRSFVVRNRAACDFAYDGQKIQPHSYRSMAAGFVQAWQDSPGHRANLLNPVYKRLGTGGSFKSNSRNCGDIVATQNFAA